MNVQNGCVGGGTGICIFLSFYSYLSKLQIKILSQVLDMVKYLYKELYPVYNTSATIAARTCAFVQLVSLVKLKIIFCVKKLIIFE